ncbi:MAG: hypothetical protein ACJ8EH_02360 [Sphingomicrobium sp.]|jgi:hypothetical protein
MPVPDPVQSLRHSTIRRFWRIFRLLGALAMIIAAIAVILVASGDPTPLRHVHMLIATALGIGLTVLVGTGLMTLVFISNSSGHDEAASRTHEDKE